MEEHSVIHGPNVLHHVSTIVGPWYLIGENHEYDGEPRSPSEYVNDVINNMHVWLEANDFAELGFMARIWGYQKLKTQLMPSCVKWNHYMCGPYKPM